MARKLIYRINDSELPDRIGNKAKNLISLLGIRKINIPQTWVLPWDAYQRYKYEGDAFMDELIANIRLHLDPSKVYAVRSSSNIEDASFHSFAGLFKTVLSIHDYDDLIKAIVEVWDSVNSESVNNYLEKLALDPEEIKMGVIIQEMVPAAFSGVLFSSNPMTGTSEIVIESVPGEGTALVQDGITPDRWVSRSGSWIFKPDDSNTPEQVANLVLEESQKIHKKINKPVDLEWVYDGQSVYWVQMREITSLKDLNIYSNRISKDVMPGMIHPLIWSINVPLINSAWLDLLEEIVGKLDIEPGELAKSFFFRSYFNMGAIGQVFSKVGLPSEGLEILMGVAPGKQGMPAFKPNIKMLRLIPRLIRFFVDKWTFEKKITTKLPLVKAQLLKFSTHPNPVAPLDEQITEINDLLNSLHEVVYLNIVTPLLASLYLRGFEKQVGNLAIDFKQFDLFEGMHELDDYNPNAALTELQEKYQRLSRSERKALELIDDVESISDVVNSDFQSKLKQFFTKFGHFSTNSNNFMAIPWRENPRAVIRMINEDKTIDRKRETRIKFKELTPKGIRKGLINLFYNRARKFTLYREKVSTQYIFGYGLFRPYFLRLSDAMMAKGWLEAEEDIFYLKWDEIQQIIVLKDASTFTNIIKTRKQEMNAFQDVVLPEVIYGDDPPPVFSGSHDRMQGTPTSQGYYSGPTKIVKDLDDFQKVLPGDVIVIPYSDVGWTPLFTRAGAVIAESGGLLSHSSIIAREYQIPAVVSVPNCMRLKDNQKVSVNGFTGEIVLLEEEQKLEEGA